MFYILDLFGTLVFAISGFLTASDKKFDVFGATIIAFVTALGGGTIRDVLIGSEPVGWMNDLNYLYLIGIAALMAFFFKKYIQKLRKTMFLFDTIGIGLFTILGLEKTITYGLSPLVAVLMGTVSAVFGGVCRDILCNEVPLIFRKEIYATICMLGGFLYLMLGNINNQLATVITFGFIIVFRILVVRKKWSLPII